MVACNRKQKQNKATKTPKTVICRSNGKLKRDNFLEAVYTYNESHPKGVYLNTKLLGIGDVESPVYINKHLTPVNKSLHAATRIWVKERKLKYILLRGLRVRNGKHLVLKDFRPVKLFFHV